MTLVDAGPLIALVNRDDADHRLCLQTLSTLTTPLLTSWTAFGEAMHVVGELGKYASPEGKWQAQRALGGLIDTGAITVAEPSVHLIQRMRTLMEQYRDTPMDLGDASLVALAEERGIRRIFSLDADFLIYRCGKKPFDVIPALP
jgi:predicted nucleic acid-binding protein